jgi:hypothetical protein
MYKTGMITMLSNSLPQQQNVNRLTCHIAIKVVSEDSCVEVSIGQWKPQKPSIAWGAIWHLRNLIYTEDYDVVD